VFLSAHDEEVFGIVVEKISVSVAHDLIWSQRSSELLFHDEAMERSLLSVHPEEPHPLLDPAVW
jgi:hypothetical protein